MHESLTNDEQFYRVALSANHSACTQCGHGSYYTIVYKEDGEEIELGSAWGDADLAEDICDLMNMAYDAGQESDTPSVRIQKLEQLGKLATELCVSLDRQAEDIGGSRKPMEIIQEIGPLTDALSALEKTP